MNGDTPWILVASIAAGAWQTMARGLPPHERLGQQPSGVRVDAQVFHGAVTAREVDGVVVFQPGVRQVDRPPHHLRRTDDRLQIEGDLSAAGHLGAQAHHVHGRDHPVGRGDHDLRLLPVSALYGAANSSAQ